MRQSLPLFILVVLAYSAVILKYDVSFVLGFTTVLIFFIIFFHAIDVFPYTLEDDVPLRALILVYPFSMAYIVFRLLDATRMTALVFGFFGILIPVWALSGSRNKRVNRKQAVQDHKKAVAYYQGLLDTTDYLKRGHLHLPDSQLYFMESEMQRFRGVLQNHERMRVVGVVPRLMQEMANFRTALERTARAAEPRLLVDFSMNEAITDKEWSVVCVNVENVGEVDGRKLSVMLEGTVDFYRRSCGVDYLRRGARQSFRFQLRPDGYGKILLGVVLEVHSAVEDLDPFDWKWRYRYEFELEVTERPSQRFGHISVQGDFVSGSKINISDSVVVRSRLG